MTITPEWVVEVLPREIETAVVAARGLSDQDLLSEEQLAERHSDAESFRQMVRYFESTLEPQR